ncbi:DUF7601 domain-containing protein [Sharpea azabuensis]|uniref:DUF7601 domain-containing protein n=1 Tax=Sharpea azabuensis TaxID=322505 RepID=UPI00051C107C|nr:DUF5979 domain-containing protein [Sharpea azabuensis]
MVDATNNALSTAWENVDKDENIVVTFTNKLEFYQNLTLKKTTSGNKSDDKFEFNINFSNIPNEGFMSDLGMIIPDDNGKAVVNAKLASGDEVTFKNVPATTKYQITEKANRGKASYNLVAGSYKKTKTNDKAYVDLATDEEAVVEGNDIDVTFNNALPEAANIVLKNRVTGSFGDYSKPFTFTVTFNNVADDEEIQVDTFKASSKNNPKVIKKSTHLKPNTVAPRRAPASNNTLSAEIILKHNESVVFKNVPKTASYSIKEAETDYEVSHNINDGNVVNADSMSKAVDNDTITFINHKDGVVPTGTHFGILTMILAFVGFLGFVFYMLLKTRNEQ